VSALIGVSGLSFAGPVDPAIDRVPSLQAIVEAEGWRVTPTQSGVYQPGMVLVPNARGTHDVVAANCVATEILVEAMAQSRIASSLRGGVKGSWGVASATASAGITKELSFVDPEQRTIPLGRLELTSACISDISRASKLRDLSEAIVVHDVLVAVIKQTVCKKIDASGRAVALGAGEVEGFSDCVQQSAAQVPVGFKSVKLRRIISADAEDAVSSSATPVPASQAAASPAATDERRAEPHQVWWGHSGYAMALVPAGSFVIGCTVGQAGRCGADEPEEHRVALSRSFYIGQIEVTQALYSQVMGFNPSSSSDCGPRCPVEQLTWREAAAFANRLSDADGLERCYALQAGEVIWPKGLSCGGYRLPTEAEWEVAARAGRDSAYAGGGTIERVGWTVNNSGGQLQAVAELSPNAYGLYDMSGNVWEWVWDAYAAVDSRASERADPRGPPHGAERVFRGGSYRSSVASARVSNRSSEAESYRSPALGLRLARTAD
jgi:formylglycine-generating enzyme required for sulfatase activity